MGGTTLRTLHQEQPQFILLFCNAATETEPNEGIAPVSTEEITTPDEVQTTPVIASTSEITDAASESVEESEVSQLLRSEAAIALPKEHKKLFSAPIMSVKPSLCLF
jgi:hypothetical protein